jgi:hypothetical protein
LATITSWPSSLNTSLTQGECIPTSVTMRHDSSPEKRRTKAEGVVLTVPSSTMSPSASLLRVGGTVCDQLGLGRFEARSLMVGNDEVWIGEFHWYGRIGGMVKILTNMVSRAGAPPSITWERDRASESWP